MQDTIKRIELLVFDQAMHVVPNRNGQLVRLMPTERFRQVSLCIGVDEQHLVTFLDRPTPRFIVVVVSLTPPFWFAIAITFVISLQPPIV